MIMNDVTSAPTNLRQTPDLEPKKYKLSYGEFVGVGENGNLWVEDSDVK